MNQFVILKSLHHSFEVDEIALNVLTRDKDGYINVTQLGHQFNERPFPPAKRFLNQLARETKLEAEKLMETQLNAPIGERCTWAHPAVAQFLVRKWRYREPAARQGMVYLATSPCYEAVKAGKWTGDAAGLAKRYRTVLTGAVVLHYVNVDDCSVVEKEFLDHFAEWRIDGEVMQKKHEGKYLAWLESKGELHTFALRQLLAR